MKTPVKLGPFIPFKALAATHFGRKIATGFAATVFLAILITVVAIYALRSVISTNDLVAFNHAQDLFDAEKLRTAAHQKVAIARGYLLSRDGLFVEDGKIADLEFRTTFDRLQKRAHTEQDRQQLDRMKKAERAHENGLRKTYVMSRDAGRNDAKVSRYFNDNVMPKFNAWEHSLNAYVKTKEKEMEEARQMAREAASWAMRLILVIAIGALALAVTLAFVLTRTLTRLYEEVGVAVRAREDVLAIVSHDLKNPLSSVMLSSALLMKSPDLPIEQRIRSARTIHTSAQQMKKLIEDLLDFVKVEFGRISVQKRLEDPNLLLADVMSVFTPLAKEKGVALHRSVAKDVDSIECDRPRIFQILSNLMGNAIKFTPTGGQVSLNITTVGDKTLFWVRDTGPGIAPEQLTRVFDRYWQAERDSRQGGVGLGLAIAKGLVEAHGGRIWAESQPGEGSTFYFTIPAPGFKTESETKFAMEGLKTALLKLPSRTRGGGTGAEVEERV